LAILQNLKDTSPTGVYLFPSQRRDGKCMSVNTLNTALRKMGFTTDQHCMHGFRATARTMLDEVLNERVDLIEHQLSHKVKDVNGNAYNRTTHLEARRVMMQKWSDYLDSIRIEKT
jgi:integrase